MVDFFGNNLWGFNGLVFCQLKYIMAQNCPLDQQDMSFCDICVVLCVFFMFLSSYLLFTIIIYMYT